MAGPTINGTALFNFTEGIQGFTEVFHWNGAGSGSNSPIQTFFDQAKQLGALRAALLGVGASLNAVRVSDDSIRGDSLVYDFDNPPLPTTISLLPKISSGDAAPPGQCIEIRFFDATGKYQKDTFLRGAPFTFFNTNSIPVFSPAWRAGLAAWANQILTPATGWALRAVSKESAQIQKITDVVRNVLSPTQWQVTTTGPQVTENFQGLLYGIKGIGMPKGLHAFHPIPAVAANTYLVIDSVVPAGGIYWSGGNLRVNTLTFVAPTSYEVTGQGNRKPGRPFDQRPGKRKVRLR